MLKRTDEYSILKDLLSIPKYLIDKEKQDCLASVRFITELLSDEKQEDEGLFFKSDKEACLVHPLIKDLLQTEIKESEQQKDKIYLIYHSVPRHQYVIEKKWENQKSVSYRLHHSWTYAFSLGEWEGADPWPSNPENSRHCVLQKFEPYRQKILNVNEIQDLLIKMIEWGDEVLRNKTPDIYQRPFKQEYLEGGLRSMIQCYPISPHKFHELNKEIYEEKCNARFFLRKSNGQVYDFLRRNGFFQNSQEKKQAYVNSRQQSRADFREYASNIMLNNMPGKKGV
ncbi:MAG: hypothetical protein K0S27_1397 [Gammaproteobacteria bacterium]|jgi:hypothetical protein|nr:hypothetical protein [Gammaproteobacteria bacterium]